MYKVLSVVLAGGIGSRLRPLTYSHAKPALAFGQDHCIIDFVMSNLLHSGLQRILVLTQYKARDLHHYLLRHWQPRINPRGMLRLHQAPEGLEQGTAGAVASKLDAILDDQPDAIAILSADHIYKMDYRQMVACHRQQHADVTVAAVAVPIEKARQFGVFIVDNHNRIIGFIEKPQDNVPEMPNRPGYALVSMGNYIFSRTSLFQALSQIKAGQNVDFGHDILPKLITKVRACIYDFEQNQLPGEQCLPHYWRDVGTLNSYFQTRLDILCHADWLSGDRQKWPILGHTKQTTPHTISNNHLPIESTFTGCISKIRRLAPAYYHYPLYC